MGINEFPYTCISFIGLRVCAKHGSISSCDAAETHRAQYELRAGDQAVFDQDGDGLRLRFLRSQAEEPSS